MDNIPQGRKTDHFLWGIWFQVCLFTLVLSTARLIFLYLVGDHQIMQSMFADFIKTIFIGLRFDLRVATILFSPVLLLGLILTTTKYRYLITKWTPFYSFTAYFLAIATSMANYFYFKTYNNHFDIFVFGLIEDDTSKVFNSIWLDYPVVISLVTCLFISILLMVFTVEVSKYFTNKPENNRAWYSTRLFVVVSLLFYSFLARGSLGTFPLKQYHATVSSYEVFNKSTPNTFLALNWAHKKHKHNAKFTAVVKSEYLRKIQLVVGQDSLTYRTEKNVLLTQSPPNVIFALMESMGTNLLLEDNKSNNDLLGALRQPFADDFLFKRFLSATDTTINSMAMMLFHSNVSTISQSTAQKKLLTGNVFLPYKKSGYKIVYITGGSATWRNLNNYMLQQGVDEFYSQNNIINTFPQASSTAGTWGVADEYTFKFAERIIKENTQPIMVVLLTQTNHSPYKVPTNYVKKPLSVSAKVLHKMSLTESKSREILSTYQYSANALGEFIQSIKKESDNTIIAATGDHRLRGYDINYPSDLGSSYSVPFYLHIPQKILASTQYGYDNLRVGSHRDIFPTLYAFSLSDSEYISLGGRNLLAKKDVKNAVAFNESVLLTSKGAINVSTPKLVYPWINNTTLQVSPEPITSLIPDLPKNYSHLQTLFINSQVKGFMPYSDLVNLNEDSSNLATQ